MRVELESKSIDAIFKQKISNSKKVSVIGLGYVGLPLAQLAATHNTVYGIDISIEKVRQLKSGKKFSNLSFYNNFDSVASSDIVVICVPTPVTDKFQPDLEPVKLAVKHVAQNLKKRTRILQRIHGLRLSYVCCNGNINYRYRICLCHTAQNQKSD